MRQDNVEALGFTDTMPNLSNPQGVHGTMQMPVSSDTDEINAAIRDKFRGIENVPRMSLTGDIRFVTHDNGDGTMEVNFEVLQ